MLKGDVFANQIFENQIFALFMNTFLNGENGVCNGYKNSMAVTYSGSDITIDSGAICIQGRFLEEDTTSTITASTDNTFCKLVIEIDLDKVNTDEEFKQGYYKIIKGAGSYPALTQTDIVNNVSGIYQYELARFKAGTTGITDFQDMRTFLDFESIYAEIEQHIQDIDDGSLWLLKTGGTITGNLTIDGTLSNSAITSINSSISTINSSYKPKSDFAVLTGSVTGTGSASLQKDISYPTGFNNTNCVVISTMLHNRSNANGTWGYGSVFDSSSYVRGSLPCSVSINDTNIKLDIKNILIQNGQYPTISDFSSSVTFDYKIVLMKIS